jgi:hypothetical protein
MRRFLTAAFAAVALLAVPAACTSNDAGKVTSALSSSTATQINNDAKVAGDVLCGAFGAYYNGLKLYPAYMPSDPTLQAAEDEAYRLCSQGLVGVTPLATVQNLSALVLKLVADQAIKMAAAGVSVPAKP